MDPYSQFMRDLSVNAVKRLVVEVYYRYLFPHIPLTDMPPPGAPDDRGAQQATQGAQSTPPQQQHRWQSAQGAGPSGSELEAGPSGRASKAARVGSPNEQVCERIHSLFSVFCKISTLCSFEFLYFNCT